MKRFFTYEEQYNLLVDRGLKITDKDGAIEALRCNGYYNLINGYSKFFKIKGRETYIEGTSFDNIFALYTFDLKLRNTLYKFTSIIECHIKAVIGHEFSRFHGIDDKVYLTESCFSLKPKKGKDQVKDLIAKCQEAISEGANKNSSRHKDYISHYKNTYGLVPLWILVRSLSFGTISKFYSSMKDKEKAEIAKEFRLTASQFSNILKIIVRFRNILAHGERTFCEHTRDTLSNLKVLNSLSLQKNEKGEIKCGRRDILALLICCKYMLNESDFEKLAKEVESAIDELKEKINKCTMSRVLDEMGLKSLKPTVLIKVQK